MKRVVVTLLLVVVWSAVLLTGTLYGWWRQPLTASDDPRAFLQAAIPLIDAGNKANTALVLIDHGEIGAEYYSRHADNIDRNTVFATASLSKWIAAHAVMKLVEQGRLDLDQPVERYLTRWKLPTGAFSSREVTARRLLSHTAGLTDALGFGDYGRDETLPTPEAELTAPRGSTGQRTSPVSVGVEPGSQFRYSGGGYLLLELLVEEVAGEPFQAFVNREILQPLGMAHSGYADLAAIINSAKSYDATGQPAEIVRYASNAATGFTTSAGDMITWVLAQLQPSSGTMLTRTTLDSMRSAQAMSMGVGIWGLGTVLYAPTPDGDVVYGHDGVNDPAISATVRINPGTGDAIIVLATGSKSLASQLGAEWVFWQTGLPDVLTIPGELRAVMPLLIAGICGIVLLAFMHVWRTRRRTSRRATQ
ncbi:MAG: beta-lactamase family protein [Halioglobus sp.]|nr:beta-lactamase family protein [Halioglobus sp.]